MNKDRQKDTNKKTYLAIDLKSFYASVECVDHGLDPLEAKLVVADINRTEKTICLAVSPALKELGIPGRARLYEVIEKAANIDFIIAPPRMQRYLEVSTKIYGVYSKFISPEDIHVYSIDEVFIDATSYLNTYHQTPEELARSIINGILKETGITATAGIGTNLYLAKVAMDIVAKHLPADKNGVRIASLNEKSYREKLWTHKPITDFWRIGRGLSKRLKDLGINTMGELAKYSITGYEKLYKVFGINAELMIDHAWGWEPVTIPEIKAYRAENHSLSSGQVLSEPYSAEKAKLVFREMIDGLTLKLTAENLETNQIVAEIHYDITSKTNQNSEMEADFYGRTVPKKSHGSINLGSYTAANTKIAEKACELFDKIIKREYLVRRIYIAANNLKWRSEKKTEQLNIFTDYEKEQEKEEKERRLQQATIKIKSRYGKNSLIKAMDLEEGATTIMRNRQVGGHQA
ncbi:DNA methylase [Candidatus Saccharibacteria bacterium]|nr:DNA methylase [Candidatus Saccharibacteria bacterium]